MVRCEDSAKLSSQTDAVLAGQTSQPKLFSQFPPCPKLRSLGIPLTTIAPTAPTRQCDRRNQQHRSPLPQYCSVKVCNCQCSGQNHENSSLSASDKSQFLVIRTVLASPQSHSHWVILFTTTSGWVLFCQLRLNS